MGIKFQGMREFEKKLLNMFDADKARDVVSQNTMEMFSEAQRTSPVDTGFMQRSHSMHMSTDGIEGTVEVGAEYGPYVNNGTRYQDAQPWFTTAYNKQRPIFMKDMKELLNG